MIGQSINDLSKSFIVMGNPGTPYQFFNTTAPPPAEDTRTVCKRSLQL